MRDSEQPRPVAVKPTEAPSGLPLLPPLAAVIEVLVLVVLPGMLDLVFPGFPALNETQPHFFWLPVLLLTLQYGSASGLLAAGTAIVLSTLLGWPEQEIGENHFSYLLRIWLQPVLWIATAVILGQFRLRQIERKEALGRAVDDLTSQRQALAAHATALRERCDRLERIVSARREPDAHALLGALGRINSDESGEAMQALDDALRLAFGQSPVSIFVTGESGALRMAHRHAPPGAPTPPSIEADGRLYQALVTSHRGLSALIPGAENELDGMALAAVPISDPDGSTTGAILLEGLDASALDEGTLDRLTAVATIVAGRLRSAETARRSARPPLPTDPRATTETPPWRRVRWQMGRHRSATQRSSRKA